MSVAILHPQAVHLGLAFVKHPVLASHTQSIVFFFFLRNKPCCLHRDYQLGHSCCRGLRWHLPCVGDSWAWAGILQNKADTVPCRETYSVTAASGYGGYDLFCLACSHVMWPGVDSWPCGGVAVLAGLWTVQEVASLPQTKKLPVNHAGCHLTWTILYFMFLWMKVFDLKSLFSLKRELVS